MSMPENDAGVNGAEIIWLLAFSCNGSDGVKLESVTLLVNVVGAVNVFVPPIVCVPSTITNVEVPIGAKFGK